MRKAIHALVATSFAVLSVGLWAAPTSTAKKKEASSGSAIEVMRELRFAQVKQGMRIRVHLSKGKPIVGTVSKIDEGSLTLDLGAEVSGLSGKFSFHRSDLVRIEEVKPMTPEQAREVVKSREAKNAQLRQMASIRIEDMKRHEKEQKAETAARREAGREIIKKETEDAYRKLLEEFPPKDGWGAEKLKSIRERWILDDLPPDAKESRFVKVYDEWKKARETIEAIDESRAEEKGRLMLLRFPPGNEWNSARLKSILERHARGEKITHLEEEFMENYEDWLRYQRMTPEVPEPGQVPPLNEQEVEPPVETLEQEGEDAGPK